MTAKELLDRITSDLAELRSIIELEPFRLEMEPPQTTTRKPKHEPRAKSIDDVIAYGLAKEVMRSDCVYFWNHCEATNWTIGGRPMHNWKAALISWRAGRYLPSQKNGNGNGQH